MEPTSSAAGGHRWIYEDLLRRLKNADGAAAAGNLGLAPNDTGELPVPFCGALYLISPAGVRRADGKTFSPAAASALIHYVLKAGSSRPRGQFGTMAQLAGPLFERSSYSQSALERPIIKRFQGRLAELLAAAAALGGRPGGEGGLGAVSLIFDLLPHLPIQLIFYEQDDEFPARATLLFDLNASQVVDFEVVAVLTTLFVKHLVRL